MILYIPDSLPLPPSSRWAAEQIIYQTNTSAVLDCWSIVLFVSLAFPSNIRTHVSFWFFSLFLPGLIPFSLQRIRFNPTVKWDSATCTSNQQIRAEFFPQMGICSASNRQNFLVPVNMLVRTNCYLFCPFSFPLLSMIHYSLSKWHFFYIASVSFRSYL
jgi:hypothetical protein